MNGAQSAPTPVPSVMTRMDLWARALRVQQWSKNLLLFVPLLAAHMAFETGPLLRTALAFVAFCLCASGVYLVNDTLDVAADRMHPRKRLRPLAAGLITRTSGLLCAGVLTIAAFALALSIALDFALILLGYWLLATLYSWRLKRIVGLDAMVLVMLYTLRLVAGGATSDVSLSFWLLAFAMFLFLSLAMLKRYTELVDLAEIGRTTAVGRGYTVEDRPLVQSFGVTSGLLSVLVLALYIDSDDSRRLYATPEALWLLCPLLLYWIFRAWWLAHRGAMDADPVVFALRDRTSLFVAAAFAASALIAR